jgi:hypothetical protein
MSSAAQSITNEKRANNCVFKQIPYPLLTLQLDIAVWVKSFILLLSFPVFSILLVLRLIDYKLRATKMKIACNLKWAIPHIYMLFIFVQGCVQNFLFHNWNHYLFTQRNFTIFTTLSAFLFV